MATSSSRSHTFPRWLRSLYCRYVVGDEHAARLLDANGGKSVNDVQRWMDKRYGSFLLQPSETKREQELRS